MKIRNPRNIMRQRSRSISLVLIGIGCLLGLRLLWVQGIQGAKFAEMAINQTEGIQTLYSPRGTIYDRNGKQLAFSVMVKSLYADPGMINVSAEDAAKELAPILNIKEDVLKKDLSGKTRFVWLKRIMDPQDSDKVEALIKEKKWKGFAFVNESKRYYPNGVLLSNVLGFVGVDDKGLDGLEMSLDSLIRGDINKQILLTDARGNPILDSSMAPYKAKEEKSVYLTIDQNIQFYAERALDRAMSTTKADGGIIIVMDPKTGEILALGNRPTYNANEFSKATEAQFKNKAVVDIYEPGSTFKSIVASAALDAGTYSADTVWHDPGAIWASGHAIKNWNEESYGDVKLVDILKFSLNTGFAHIGLLTGGDILTDYAKKFGFGKPTGIELPGEGSGILFDPKEMRPLDVATMAIGQSIAVTPLQMVQAYSAIANGGKMVKPHLISSIKNPDGSDYSKTNTEIVGQPISKNVADQVKDMMEKEVSEGGGINAKIPGYHMCGKTGTAQKLDTVNGGYLGNEHIASFCGFGPTEDPRAICLIVLDNPKGSYYGSLVAAPVFKEVMGQIMRYFGIQSTDEINKQNKATIEHNDLKLPKLPSDNETDIVLPDFTGFSIRDVGEWLENADLRFKPEGTGFAISQSPGIGATVKRGSDVRVVFSE